MPKYTVIIYTPQELNHSSFIQTGLFELEKLGYINVKIKLDTNKSLGRFVVEENNIKEELNQAFPKVSYYKLINNETKRALIFATDLYDFSNEFSLAAKNNCDYVFKRNFESSFVNKLPKKYQEKIAPLGLTFGVHSEFKRKGWLFFIGLLLSNLKVNYKFDRTLFKRISNTLKRQIKHWDFVQTSRKISRFSSSQKATKKTVFFQTRCFLYDTDEDVVNIHEQRYHIIKLLKKTFPSYFLGGFIASRIATKKYSDALSNVPSAPELYLDTLKNAKIVIYTRGLVNSPAWKMAEYLSQGKVIIAERLTAELPVPLVHGKEVLFFDSDEELIANIKMVLDDNDLCDRLSKNAKTYFDENVHPVKNVKRILDLMITKLDN